MATLKKPSGAHALVFGASGLAGWAVVDQLLENYPVEGTFSKVTALANRPLSVADSYWPSPSPLRPKLDLISGVNLAEGTVEEFMASLKEKADDIAEVTHAFYFGEFQEGSVADTLSV
jgi:nucleoside-diphosphate-sugar epimerase